MAERLTGLVVEKTVRLYIPQFLYEEYMSYPNDPGTLYICRYTASVVTDFLVKKGLVNGGESLKVVFAADDMAEEDAFDRRIKFIEVQKKMPGNHIVNAKIKRLYLNIPYDNDN